MDAGSAMDAVNWLAVIVAAIATFLLGAIWYGPLLGKPWGRASGISEDRPRDANMARTFGVAFVLQLLAAFALAMFIGAEAGVGFGTFAGFMTGAFFVATAFGVVYLFEQRPLALWAIDAGYQIVAFTMMGAILGAW